MTISSPDCKKQQNLNKTLKNVYFVHLGGAKVSLIGVSAVYVCVCVGGGGGKGPFAVWG